jgi:hypothetical protein
VKSITEQLVRVTDITAHDPDRVRADWQGRGEHPDHGVVVGVHHPAGLIGGLDDLVRVPHRGQARADVQELADTPQRDPLGRALVESAVGPGAVLDLRRQPQYALRGVPVGGEVMPAVQKIVVNARGRRPGLIDSEGQFTGASQFIGVWLSHGRVTRPGPSAAWTISTQSGTLRSQHEP